MAEIVLNEAFQRTIPSGVGVYSYVPGINQVLIDDVDGDNSRDLVFDNEKSLAVYSILGDSVIFNFAKAGGLAAAGYLDEDNRWDVVNCRMEPQDSAVCAFVVVHLSSDNWEPSDTIVIGFTPIDSSYKVLNASLLDLDHDGIPELYINYAYYVIHDIPWDPITIETVSIRRKYSFVDSTVSEINFSPLKSYELHDLFPGEPPVYLAQLTSTQSGETYNHVHYTWTSSSIRLFRDTTTVKNLYFNHDMFYNCGSDGFLRSSAVINGHVVGDIRSDLPGLELLVSVTREHSCYDQTGYNRYRENEFIWLDLSSASLMDTISIVPVDSARPLGPLMASYQYPDHLLTMVNKRIQTLDPVNFNPLDSSRIVDSVIGTGCEFVALQPLVDDGPEYLVLRSGGTFHFLTLEQLIPNDTIPDPDTTVVPDPDTTIAPDPDSVTIPEPQPPLLPKTFAVGKPFPNPFNPSVSIPVALPTDTRLTLTVFDITGRKIEKIECGTKSAGETTVIWDASTHPTGVYFIRITAGSEERTVKTVLLK